MPIIKHADPMHTQHTTEMTYLNQSQIFLKKFPIGASALLFIVFGRLLIPYPAFSAVFLMPDPAFSAVFLITLNGSNL